jgi:acyl-coenzyme A synthetase/AMP-(fatty) acid ligase
MNLAHIIDAHPDSSAALVSRGRSTTYGTLRQQIASMRGALLRENVGKGDVVALLCGNSRYFVVSYFAAIGIGAIIAPLNPTSPAPEIEGELLVIKPTVVVVEPSAAAAWELIPAVISSAVRVVIGTEGHSIPGALTIDDMLSGAPADIIEVESSHPAAYMFTSGTAGSPKAAAVSYTHLRAHETHH